jgi:PKD repeat protein
MKHIFHISTLLFLALFAVELTAQNTVYFDLQNLEQQYTFGQQEITIPVYISGSNEQINALDFWFQFNTNKYTYVSTDAVQSVADVFTHYNTENDVLSNTTSTPDIETYFTLDTPVLTLQFVLLNPCDEILLSDFYTTEVLVNGEQAEAMWTAPVALNNNIQITTPQPWCAQSTIDFGFVDEINGQMISQFAWASGASTSQEETASFTFPNAGTIGIELTATTEAGCQLTYMSEISIISGPSISFAWTGEVAQEAIAFENNTLFLEGTITGYSWNFGDNSTSTDIDPTHIYASPGLYDVTLIADGDNGCSSTLTQSISITSSIADIDAQTWSVYPNPATDLVYVTHTGNESVLVYTILGDRVHVQTKKSASNITLLDVSSLSKGIYFVQLGQSTKKIVVR